MSTAEGSRTQLNRPLRAAAYVTSVRQLDWRFLLTETDQPIDHLVWLGATPELARLAIDRGVARRVSLSLPSARTADVLVVTRSSAVPRAQAAGCLHHRGSAYYELGRGPLDVTAGDGGSPIQVYWTTRGAAGVGAHLPGESTGPAAWYADASPEPLGATTRLRLIAASRLPPAVLARLRLVAPERAVVVGPSSPAVRFRNLVGEGHRQWALLTPGTRERSSVVLLPFERGGAEPLAVVKTVRSAEQTGRLRSEQTVLREIRAGLSPELERTIPEPLGLRQIGSLTLSIESYCRGRPLATSSGDRATSTQRKVADLRLAARWLTELHRQTRVGRAEWTPESVGRWISEPIRQFETAFGSGDAERRLFALTRQRAEQLVGIQLPLVRQHNDFDPWNVHRQGQRVGVFDWERSVVGPPLADLLYFVTIWSSLAHHLIDRRAQARDFERLYLEPGATDSRVRAARSAIAAYMASLGIQRAFLPIVLVMTVLNRALDRVDGACAGTADSRTGNRHVVYLDVLARRYESMFAEPGVWIWAR